MHEKRKPYKCSSCHYRSSFKGNVTKHMIKAHEGIKSEKIIYLGPKIRKCPVCEFTCGEKLDLTHHIFKVHKGKCNICDKSCKTRARLENHMKSVHEKNKQYKCSGCHYRSSFRGNVRKHSERVHDGKIFEVIDLEAKIEINECITCKANFQTKMDLENHSAKGCDKKKPFQCSGKNH